MGLLDDAAARRRQRRDPLGRLGWPFQLLALVLVLALCAAQIVLGSGLSRVLGVLLLVMLVPSQAVGTWAAWKVSREGR